MIYTITKSRWNMLMGCSIFLILNYLLLGFSSLLLSYSELDPTVKLVSNLLTTIAYGYLMLIISGYFRHFKLKVQQNVTLVILTIEILIRILQSVNTITPTISQSVFAVITPLWIVAVFVWNISLFLIQKENYNALQSIRKYAIAILITPILIAVGSSLLLSPETLNYTDLFSVLIAIPFIFTIEFAFKLRIKKASC